MKTPSLWMFAAGCFGPVICRTRAISLYRDVKRRGRALARNTFGLRSPVSWSAGSSAQHVNLLSATGFALLALLLGPVASVRRSISQNSLQGVTSSSTIGTDLTGLRRYDLHRQKWTRASQSQLRPT